MNDAYLAHHGVKGMRWGIRRYRNKDGSLTSEGRKREQRRNIKRKRREDSKNRSLMSDAELDRKIKRLEKEKRLKDLTESEVSPGRTYAKRTMDRYGNQLVGIAIGATVGTAAGVVGKNVVKPMVKKKLGVE